MADAWQYVEQFTACTGEAPWYSAWPAYGRRNRLCTEAATC